MKNPQEKTMLKLPSTKEAAIMRAQGTTRLRTFFILSLEQVLLCLIGMTLTAVALSIYDMCLPMF